MGFLASNVSQPNLAINDPEDMPMVLDDISAEWIGRAIGIKVDSIKVDLVLPGTATKVLISIDYGSRRPKDAPQTVCLKGGFSHDLRDLALGLAYRREAEFLAHVATSPKLQMRLPRVWYAATNVRQNQGLVVLENLTATGCTFGECTIPLSVQHVGSGLQQLASLHGLTWGCPVGKYPWMTSANPIQEVAGAMFSKQYWEQHFSEEAVRSQVPADMLDRTRMFAAFRQMWSTADPKLRCIVHGDPHPGNLFFAPGGELGFLDFQAVFSGSSMHDVAYFVAGSLTVEDRRSSERHLLEKYYLPSLHKAGGPQLSIDQIWDDYRRHQLHGFFWAMTGTLMQTKERAAAMAARHIAAIQDHNTLKLLER
ncbi:uncharacterized protein E0L32_010891 [Thyridium curvatum]|uniref:CHK kinase-like domain-containing protein n=1 Tax=Thyridium curvatum TaxID=1093900 RepID=A0A507AQM3_9PEZI|nr:uncharacterized protein E0L32_010891 [Thyridium curvatum]TPX07188.1 hypothetical protein E0L32_010891 [Thyridium curvatum]